MLHISAGEKEAMPLHHHSHDLNSCWFCNAWSMAAMASKVSCCAMPDFCLCYHLPGPTVTELICRKEGAYYLLLPSSEHEPLIQHSLSH